MTSCVPDCTVLLKVQHIMLIFPIKSDSATQQFPIMELQLKRGRENKKTDPVFLLSSSLSSSKAFLLIGSTDWLVSAVFFLRWRNASSSLVCFHTYRQVVPALTLPQLVGRHTQVKLWHGIAGDGVVEMKAKGHKPSVHILGGKEKEKRYSSVAFIF